MPKIEIKQDWCKGCYICVEFCPKSVLEVDEVRWWKGFHPVVVAHPEECTGCRQCELLCPDLAIAVVDSALTQRGRGKASPCPEEKAISLLGKSGWTKAKSPLGPGRYFMQGDEACAEGAITAGCNFYAGYPITPASEIMHRICHRFAELRDRGERRVFAQMEDELGSIASCIGASWAGAKAMTATSGPGLSLMLENIGYAIGTETPVVIVDVQRVGPTTGQATRPAQGDVLQVRFGAHGDYEIIALSPWSVQEMYELTIRAFNLAERFRVPVFVLADEAVGHLRENFSIPAEVRIYNRRKPRGKEPPFGGGAEMPPMPAFGEGHQLLVTGSTHDEWGYRHTADPQTQARLVAHLSEKITSHLDEIVEADERLCEGTLDVLVIAYGFTARSAWAAVKRARGEGIQAGLLRLRTIWPFPEEAVRRLAERAQKILGAEMNRGQILREVQRIAPRARGYSKTNGEVITPGELLAEIKKTVSHLR